MQGTEEQRICLEVVSKTVATFAPEWTALQKGGRGGARWPSCILSEQEVMCYCIASSCVGEVILSRNQPRPDTSKHFRAEEARNTKTSFSTQSTTTPKISSHSAAPSHAALDEQRVGAGEGFRGEAAVAALWAQLRLLLLAAGLSLGRHVARFISRLGRT